jgi:hypothetical protein
MVSLIWIGVLNFGLACVMHGSRFMFELMTLHCKNVQKFLSREITTFCTGGQKKRRLCAISSFIQIVCSLRNIINQRLVASTQGIYSTSFVVIFDSIDSVLSPRNFDHAGRCDYFDTHNQLSSRWIMIGVQCSRFPKLAD